jgi:hypothetical protein
MTTNWDRNKLLAAGILAAGVAGAGFLGGQSLVHSRLGFRTVTVKGLAERPVKADLGFWPIRFVATGGTLEEARQRLETSEAAVRAYLTAKGFKPENIQVKNIRVQDKAADYSQGYAADARFILNEDILVTSTEVDRLAAAARTTGDLLKAGVVFSSDSYNAGPSYVFTGINALKGDLLAEATTRAREAAQTFAQQSGARVGGIQNASQGVIEVNPAVEIPDESADKQIDKKVRVVSTITYFLK